MSKKVLSVGNLYLETNFLGTRANGEEVLVVGKEYSANHYESLLGGSAVNFATQLKKLGVDVGVLGKIGEDDEGVKLKKLLSEAGVENKLVQIEKDVQTNYAFGVVFDESGQNIQFAAGSANQSLSIKDIDLDSGDFDEISAVYFGGSFKQKLLWPYYPEIFQKLKQKGVKIFLDHGRVPVDASEEWISFAFKSLPYVEGYFLNNDEVVDVTKENDIEKSLDKIKSCNPGFIALKLGPEGCRIETQHDSIVVVGHKVKAVNTVGAGDAFNAGFISKFLLGSGLEESARFANALAAIRVSLNYQPSQKEVDDFLNK